ncbi:hypothetical protein [Micromonospora halophytica]|uniref:Polymorphic outer membrane protein repeat-containing protein n=1 Tax=Micromonospora halophytica TaxID=47864 RepID=A0A1C5HGY6_9ACTN|nr:hypothetical protein [Micromonospora halophytica]SCG45329.1 polymorphic outer membrane protein repeat-containing protein [Micromonospora halophytica]
MSTYRGGRRAARPGRRPGWFLAGGLVAGSLVAGAAGLTGVAAMAADRGLSFAKLGAPTSAVTKDDGGRWERPDTGREQNHERGRPAPPGGRHDDRKPIFVPCEATKLIAALVRANAEGGAVLQLAPKCTYTLGHAFLQNEEWDGGLRDAREANDAAEQPGDAEAPPRDPRDDATGLPVIYQPVTIRGAGATIERGGNAEAFRFFTVRDGGELFLSDVTLRNGKSTGEGGSVHVVHGAAAVLTRVTVVQSTSLSAESGGGGVFNDGNLVVDESTFIGNRAAGAAGKGGGLLNGGVLTLRKSEFRDNSAVAYGGGLGNFRAAAEVDGATFVHNNAAQGGGIASFSARTKVADTAVIGNTAQTGGGIANSDAVIILRGMKIRDNTATVNGGGISTFQGLLPLDDSVVAGNTARGHGGGIYAEKSNVLVRTTDVNRNHAVGNLSKAGGIYATMGKLSVFKSSVFENAATLKPGGVFAAQAGVRVDDETDIVGNAPTNCEGSTVPIPHCFR